MVETTILTPRNKKLFSLSSDKIFTFYYLLVSKKYSSIPMVTLPPHFYYFIHLISEKMFESSSLLTLIRNAKFKMTYFDVPVVLTIRNL